MNIFMLHSVPAIAASYHCDKHVGKMLIESCQLLATAHHLNGNGTNVSYKPTHVNHPCAIWTRASAHHYLFVAELAHWLGFEFRARYGKQHCSADILVRELSKPPAALLSNPSGWATPPLAMPDAFKSEDHIASYRAYYRSKRDTMVMSYYRGQRLLPEFMQ